MRKMMQKIRHCFGWAVRAFSAVQSQFPMRSLLIGSWYAADGMVACQFCADGIVSYRGRYGRYVFEEDRLVLLWPGEEPVVLKRNAGDPVQCYAVTRQRLLIFGEVLTSTSERNR